MYTAMKRACKLTVGLFLIGVLVTPSSSNLMKMLHTKDKAKESKTLPHGYVEKYYMNVPRKNSEFNAPLHQHVREALSKLPIEAASDPHATLPTPHQVLAAISKAEGEEKNSAHRAIYEQLAKLADEELNDCSTYMVEVIKSVWAQTKAKKIPKRLAESLKGYLFEFGANAMDFCINQIEVEDLNKYLNAETALTQFFFVARRGYNGDATIYQALATLNLYKDKLDVHQMSNVAQKWVAADLPPTKRQPLSMMRELLNTKCLELLVGDGTTFDFINLARIFGPEREHISMPRLLQLNELNRLCLSWVKDPSLKILDRLHIQLDGTFLVLGPAPSDGEE